MSHPVNPSRFRKPIVALDADGVLLDYGKAYASAWQRAFGEFPALKNPRAYWPIDRWHVERLDGERLQHFRASFDEEFWNSIPAIVGAVEACEMLVNAGYVGIPEQRDRPFRSIVTADSD